MKNPRKKIELLKREIRSQLETDTQRYKRAIIREIQYQWERIKKTSQAPSLQQLQDKIFSQLRIPLESRKALTSDLNETQKEIAQVWDDYFSGLTGKQIKPAFGDYEKMLASNKVDFPALEESLRDKLKSQFVTSIRQEYSFEKLRSNLLKNDLGEWQAYTEANTAIAQFDNAYHIENALQAGVEKFLWDGPPTLPNSHDLCIQNVGKEFTLEELQSMDNGTDLPVETSLGGYNCRHYLTAVISAK